MPIILDLSTAIDIFLNMTNFLNFDLILCQIAEIDFHTAKTVNVLD